MKSLEIEGCREVRLPYSNRTVLVPDGYTISRKPYSVEMALVPDPETYEAEKSDLIVEIDNTINAVCKTVQLEGQASDSYADNVMALAALVEARFGSSR